ncbi:MAG: hydantoinase/oxoprolinase family protein [Candidatus Tectomicrobia bacterium]|uniref:Hydantoinase/oxoprolinase family protein n=1 Tax=Tectimicrobiota bacterium TaxID=2528274 RepID=A0A932CQC1_UNCTE|nr:hydantoinase/oxoprolinase family protein [Candidatus Tectomicrobia bacterium]
MTQYLIALDAGGTMTDSFCVDEEGRFIVGKALTNPGEEWKSYLESVRDGMGYWQKSSTECHRNALASIYTGTAILNTILTLSGQKVGLLITRGQKDLPVIERGYTWSGLTPEDLLHQILHEHPPYLIEPDCVREISERIGGGSYYGDAHYPPGKVVQKLNEQEVIEAVEDLLAQKVEIIGILFLYSYLNPSHEKRAVELAQQVVQRQGLNLRVVSSHEIAPVMRESERWTSLLYECYAGEESRKQLKRIEAAAREEGYPHPLLTVLAYGGVATTDYPRFYETIISGPVGGLIGAEFLSQIIGRKDIICCDMGGTSFDVGLIVEGKIGIKKDPDFARRRLALPMVNLDSIGAGAGMVVRVDEKYRIVTLGPESAGSRVGVCLDYPEPTVSDVNVALGYLNPDNFLGGKIKLDRDKAIRVLEERVARPLDTDLFKAGSGILDLIHSKMKDHIYYSLLARGYNPADYLLLIYGGSGPLHLWGICEGVPFGGVMTVPWAAAFSAFGISCADFVHRYHQGIAAMLKSAAEDPKKMAVGEGINAAWAELEAKARREFDNFMGISPEEISFTYGGYGKYIGQIEYIEFSASIDRIRSPQDLERLAQDFEKAYTTVYPAAARYPEAGYFFNELYVEARAEKRKPVLTRHPLQGRTPSQGYKGTREVFHRDRWQTFDIWEMEQLAAGNVVEGPAVIEHPMTTLVVPGGKRVELDAYRFIWYQDNPLKA